MTGLDPAMNGVTDVRDQQDPEPPRALPDNLAAEQALLGALLCCNGGFARIADIVRADNFRWAVHQRIFDAIGKLVKTGTPANPVTMRHLFDNDPAIREAYRGGKYLAWLARSAVTLLNGPDYALIIADLALRRDLICELEEPRPGETAVDILTTYRPRIEALARAARTLVPRGRRGRS
jgi:replicative DNA helicase